MFNKYRSIVFICFGSAHSTSAVGEFIKRETAQFKSVKMERSQFCY